MGLSRSASFDSLGLPVPRSSEKVPPPLPVQLDCRVARLCYCAVCAVCMCVGGGEVRVGRSIVGVASLMVGWGFWGLWGWRARCMICGLVAWRSGSGVRRFVFYPSYGGGE